MNKEESIEYWTKQLEHAESARRYATEQLGRLSVDDMLLGADEPVTNVGWPNYTDMGEYIERD